VICSLYAPTQRKTPPGEPDGVDLVSVWRRA
jgi:hypothetical protein